LLEDSPVELIKVVVRWRVEERAVLWPGYDCQVRKIVDLFPFAGVGGSKNLLGEDVVDSDGVGPKTVLRMSRKELKRHGWPQALQHLAGAVIEVVDDGRVVAGIVADAGPITPDTLYIQQIRKLDQAVGAGRETRVAYKRWVAARVVPPGKIAEILGAADRPKTETRVRRETRPRPAKRRPMEYRADEADDLPLLDPDDEPVFSTNVREKGSFYE